MDKINTNKTLNIINLINDKKNILRCNELLNTYKKNTDPFIYELYIICIELNK